MLANIVRRASKLGTRTPSLLPTLCRSQQPITNTGLTTRLGQLLKQPQLLQCRQLSSNRVLESTPVLQSNGNDQVDSDTIKALLPILASQPTQYVTVHIHGRPYLVTQGDQVRLPFRMPGVKPGDIIRLNCASVLGSRDITLKGSPYIDDQIYTCRAIVLGVEAEPMRIKIKKKRRTRKTKLVKSKHRYTILRISELSINNSLS